MKDSVQFSVLCIPFVILCYSKRLLIIKAFHIKKYIYSFFFLMTSYILKLLRNCIH